MVQETVEKPVHEEKSMAKPGGSYSPPITPTPDKWTPRKMSPRIGYGYTLHNYDLIVLYREALEDDWDCIARVPMLEVEYLNSFMHEMLMEDYCLLQGGSC